MKEMLNNLINKSLESEGITPFILKIVDLEIEYSPVIALKGEKYDDAVEAIKTEGGKYLIRHPLVPHAVDEDALKVMRCRFLIAKPKWKSFD